MIGLDQAKRKTTANTLKSCRQKTVCVRAHSGGSAAEHATWATGSGWVLNPPDLAPNICAVMVFFVTISFSIKTDGLSQSHFCCCGFNESVNYWIKINISFGTDFFLLNKQLFLCSGCGLLNPWSDQWSGYSWTLIFWCLLFNQAWPPQVLH